MSIQFLHGDCLEIMPTLPDKSIDCFICDLPYGCLTKTKTTPEMVEKYGKGRRNTYEGCPWDTKINLEKFWEQVERLAKNDNTPVIHFCNTKFGFELYNSKPNWFRYELVWNKSKAVGFLSANKQPLRNHEMIYIFSKKGAYYKRIDIEVEGAKKWVGIGRSNVYSNEQNDTISGGDGVRCVKSVIHIANENNKGQHPTQKPIELYKWLLSRYCPEGGTILDATAGSFNSCKAGRELGLHAIGIEKDEAFYNKAVENLK